MPDPMTELAAIVGNLSRRMGYMETVPGMDVVRLADVLLDADTATVDMTDIAQGFFALMLMGSVKSSRAGSNDILQVRFNGDGSANYHGNNVVFSSAGLSSSAYTAQAQGSMASVIGTVAFSAGQFTPVWGYFGMYGAAYKPQWVSLHRRSEGAPAANQYLSMASGILNVTGAITSMSFFMATGPNIVAGSRLTLYGVR